MWLVSLGVLVFQRDLGSSLLFFGLFLVMLYVATERPGWLVVGGAAVRRPAPTSATSLFGHVQSRVDAWLHPFDPRQQRLPDRAGPVRHGAGAACSAAASGQGDPTLIPFSYSDFIVASIGEELGLTGRDGGAAALRPDRRARPAHRPGLPRRRSAS